MVTNLTLSGSQSSAFALTNSITISLFVGALLALLGCGGEHSANSFRHIEFGGSTMGTTYQVQAVVASNFSSAPLEKLVTEELQRLSSIFSTYDPKSELSRFNLQAGTSKVAISQELAHVLAKAQAIGEASGDSLDVTVSPLVDLWGFGPLERVPFSVIEAQLPQVAQYVGNHLLVVNEAEPSLVKKHAKLNIDLSALAKGYAVDRVYELLKVHGIDNLLVEIGGEVKAGGQKLSEEDWRTGLERPDAGKRTIGWVLSLNEQAVASSGDYRHYFERDGVRYSHVIDPKTGSPIRYKNVSVSVVHSQAMVADAWATAFTVLGHVDGLRVAEEQNIAVQFAVGKQIYRSTKFNLLRVKPY